MPSSELAEFRLWKRLFQVGEYFYFLFGAISHSQPDTVLSFGLSKSAVSSQRGA